MPQFNQSCRLLKSVDVTESKRFGLVFYPCVRTVVHQKHPTGLCEHCGEEESVEHVICVCQKYTNERKIMKNELRKMGVDELKLKI